MAQRSSTTYVFLALGLFGILAIGRYACGTGAPDTRPAPVPSPSISASVSVAAPVPSGTLRPDVAPLLGGLRLGDAIGEWTLIRVRDDGKLIALDFERRGSGVTVWIAKKGTAPSNQLPQFETTRYEITHGSPRAYGEPIPEGSSLALATAIKERVEKSEGTTAMPAGM